MSLSNITLTIVLFCISYFTVVQPLLLAAIGNGATTITNAALAASLTLLYFCNAHFRQSLKSNGRYLPGYILALTGLLVNLLSHLDSLQRPEKIYIALFFVAFSAILSCKALKKESSPPIFLSFSFVVASLFISVTQFARLGLSGGNRVSLFDEVTANLNYLPIASFLLFLHLFAKQKLKMAAFTGIAVAILLILTQSRSAFIAIFLTVLLTTIFNRGITIRNLLLFLATTVIAALLLIRTGLLERFTGELGGETIIDSPRIILIRDLYYRFLETPIFGTGYATESEIRYDPHNLFLEILLQGGIVGLFTMAPIIVVGAVAAYKSLGKSPLATFSASAYFCLLIGNQFTGSVLLNVPLWIVLGLVLSSHKVEFSSKKYSSQRVISQG